ncbi:IS30 family transposase [Enterococcus faecalis]|uniref:IS30 family transposase n=1 Tax=Enterococcus faecalis TaxID=1351 RepID=A0A8B3RTI3_ENTFL|nr:IS30 family transposase [Enterococcus faecalis]EGO2735947.1 IS30 family transposase [Enterococcus faecalis]EGO2810020.1 IS30 family transposase [Enterococcus faecalis]EGO5042217.1 IS30 family transposase [Enterococcus faecalis]EGO5115740.1 IS30 family transposase [Enterococcus faecalis]EGO5141356.1 IS30 family transposase [Enterococcus faecalis]
MITVDNEKEFSNYEELEDKLCVPVYFADPYCSWQRGTNENTNGLLREYIPKVKDI